MRLRIIVLFGLTCILPVAVGKEAATRLAQKYELHQPGDYRAAMNTKEFDEHTLEVANWRASDDYELAALLLGYKPMMLPDDPSNGITALKHNPDISELQQENTLYYAEVPSQWGEASPLLYRADSRHTALCFLKYMILECIDDDFRSQLGGEYNKLRCHWYMMGTVLGYPEEDIQFFFQRSAFYDTYGYFPEDSEQARRQFSTFLCNEWPYDGALKFQEARNQITRWLQQQGAQEELQSQIDSLLHEHPELQAGYDQPFQCFIQQYEQGQLMRVLSSIWRYIMWLVL